MAKLYKTTGEIETVKPENKKFSLRELQNYVGGFVELLIGQDGERMFVNEEGRIDGLPYNENASQFARRQIVGNMLVTDKNENAA